MKKTVFLLFALSVLTFGCADNSEDTIPDPVVPEVNLDNEKSSTEPVTQTSKKDAKRKVTRIRG
ncbi:hypothetical protein [Roseivirga misakiensis]|uniref:Uncharacterized protein n=1 Tax=Roseivirga misakiensis TaxID=1563681 RepID=A0A1E5T4L3_9BACT|nr:hypothetical protein [Roseivirga misakiensis]OEK06318.1 hypothetical protein BFP71_01180 [Roseivirga misakiensis]